MIEKDLVGLLLGLDPAVFENERVQYVALAVAVFPIVVKDGVLKLIGVLNALIVLNNGYRSQFPLLMLLLRSRLIGIVVFKMVLVAESELAALPRYMFVRVIQVGITIETMLVVHQRPWRFRSNITALAVTS